jgi:hypothetical protein
MSTFADVGQLVRPWLLALAGALLGGVGSLSIAFPRVQYLRWYRSLLSFMWVIAGMIAVVTIGIASPLALLAALAGVLFVALFVVARYREGHDQDTENLEFIQTAASYMSGGHMAWSEVLRQMAASKAFGSDFPRVAEQLQIILGYQQQTGNTLADAMRESMATSSNLAFWRQISAFTALATESQLGVDAQFEGISTLQHGLETKLTIQAQVKREMMQMKAAQALLLFLLPGLNIYYMFVASDVYLPFVNSLLGKIVLILEGLSMIVIFIIFQALQKIEVPEW